MSQNLSKLAERRGVAGSVFEDLRARIAAGTPVADAVRAVSQASLLPEGTLWSLASAYDFTRPAAAAKPALVCDGSACRCAGTQDAVHARLTAALGADQVGQVCCLGRCHENHAFSLRGHNFSGHALEQLAALLADPAGAAAANRDTYAVGSLATPPLLTAPFTDLEDWYAPLHQYLLGRAPADLLEELRASRLRGRGGAGFPVALKWAGCRGAAGAPKYIVCNADEGDPGAYSDRYLLEQQPHAVLFGMLVAGYICGASEGVLYIRAEYPEAVARVKAAIAELAATGWFTGNGGDDASEFAFRFSVITGAGAYICGEETALLASIEGRRPEVSVRPPYPTEAGLFGRPTVVNNVETFACIRPVFYLGGDAFARIGPPTCTGTKLISVDGSVYRPGVYEVPMGTPLPALFEGPCGGFRRALKALHIGGPLGGIVPLALAERLSFDVESFQQAGFLLGHGSVVGIPATMPLRDYLEHLFAFTAAESCGKCIPCRIGSRRGQELLAAARTHGTPIDRQLFDDLLDTLADGSLCALGGGLPLPVRNALTHFAKELAPLFDGEAHR